MSSSSPHAYLLTSLSPRPGWPGSAFTQDKLWARPGAPGPVHLPQTRPRGSRAARRPLSLHLSPRAPGWTVLCWGQGCPAHALSSIPVSTPPCSSIHALPLPPRGDNKNVSSRCRIFPGRRGHPMETQSSGDTTLFAPSPPLAAFKDLLRPRGLWSRASRGRSS